MPGCGRGQIPLRSRVHGSGFLVGLRDSASGTWFRDPLSCEIVSHELGFHLLQPWVLSYIQAVVVEDGYEWMMVGDNMEVL